MIDDYAPPRAPETVASLATDPERFNQQREALRRYCLAFLRNEHDAEDAVQVTLERALRYGTVHKDGGRWLLAIARNVCRDVLAARRGDGPLPDEDCGACLRSAGLDPADEVATRHLLAGALQSLTPGERRAVGQSWLLDQTSYDAARSVGIAHQTLRVHLARARRKLALYIDEAERATAGFVPWLWSLPHRALRRDASWGERLGALTAPALALAVTVASVAVIAVQRAPSPPAALSPGLFAPLTLPRPGAGRAGHGDMNAAVAAVPGAPDILRGLQSVLSPGRPQDAYMTDVQPSPTYAQDRTVYASATDSACQGNAGCGELFVSRDAGHTWTNLRTVGLQPFAQLVLPAASYSSGIFYAFGSAGLQITEDGGRDFLTLVNDLPGYAGPMPPSAATFVSVANVDLWNFATAPVPGLEGAYTGSTAVGAAVPVRRAGGWVLLQPVKSPGAAEQVLVCGGGGVCGAGSQLPWGGGLTRLVAAGQTVVALGDAGLAVSRDAGLSFAAVALPPGIAPLDVAISGDLLVVVATAGSTVEVLAGEGGGWQRVGGLPAQASPRLVRSTAGGALILELVRSGNPQSLAGFYCSPSGLAWSAC